MMMIIKFMSLLINRKCEWNFLLNLKILLISTIPLTLQMKKLK